MMRSIAAELSVFTLDAHVQKRIREPSAAALSALRRRNVATTGSAGVTVNLTGDSWKGDPSGLGRLLMPVRVTITNLGGKSLLVSYAAFTLSDTRGLRCAAIRPIKLHCALGTRDHDVSVTHQREAQSYCGRYYANSRERVPTQDTLSAALPEGALQDGGRVAGFVYFQSVTGCEVGLALEMTLADASDGHEFGHIAIPFQTNLV